MREAVIVSMGRSAVGKAPRGKLKYTRPDDMAGQIFKGVLDRAPQVNYTDIEDVVVGCAFPEGEQGMNMARTIALRAGLPVDVPAQTVNRFCSSGLQAIALAAQSIMVGYTDVALAGGVESMSMIPMGGSRLSPNPYLMESFPDYYLAMGLTAERVAERYGISRYMQDEFGLASQQKAAKAQKEGKFIDEIIPIEATMLGNLESGRIETKKFIFDKDEGIRETTLEKLSKLKPPFKLNGTVTAGNASQTSDGAAAVLLMSKEKCEELGLKSLAVLRSFAVAGVEPGVMGIGPIKAIPKALKIAGIDKDDLNLIELNEAFASQALACIKELELDESIINVNGGAIALGHPLGCTGAKLTVTLLSELTRRKGRYGLVSMCIGGGMGAAAVFERI